MGRQAAPCFSFGVAIACTVYVQVTICGTLSQITGGLRVMISRRPPEAATAERCRRLDVGYFPPVDKDILRTFPRCQGSMESAKLS